MKKSAGQGLEIWERMVRQITVSDGEIKGMQQMHSTLIKWMVAVSCIAALTACGGGSSSPDGAQSPADKYGDGSGGGGGGAGGGDGDGDGSNTPGVVKMGNGTGANFVDGAIAASDSSLQAGASTDIVVNLVDGSNAAIDTEYEVSFSSDCSANAQASFSQQSVQTSSGRASVIYSAQGCSGTDTVIATAVVEGTTLRATADLTIAADEVLALEFVSAEPAQLSLRGMGGVENSRVTFKLVGEQGAAIRNELVTFSLNTTAGGITLAPNEDGDPTSETVTSDNSGLASVVVRSGTVATNIRVTATHNATGINGTSADLLVSTGVPVYSKFSLSFGPQAPAGALGTDGIAVSINIIASDQVGNDAPDGTQISFWSEESGNIDRSCVLSSGECTVNWVSAGERPIDGRATFIAYTNGAEDFEDLNGNHVFDEGEEWVNLPEAFADHNENGTHDSGEYFVDVPDANPTRGVVGAWDAVEQLPDVWDGPCRSDQCPDQALSSVTIWRTSEIIHSYSNATIFEFAGATGPDGCPAREPNMTFEPEVDDIDLRAGPVKIPMFYVADARDRALLPCHILGNPMASGTTIEFSTDNGTIIRGNESLTVPDRVQEATTAGPITIEADDEPSTGTLTLTITSPEADATATNFYWTVID